MATIAQDPPAGFTYDAFLSYSHEDAALSRTLQGVVQRFALPRGQLRSVRLFRDGTGLRPGPSLLGEVHDALTGSRWFVLLASPAAARSTWVTTEIEWWLANRGVGSLLIVLISGTARWDPGAGRFTPDSDAIPVVLHEAFPTEPHWLQITAEPATRSGAASRREAREHREWLLSDLSASLIARMRDVRKDDIFSQELTLQRRARRRERTVVAAIATLVVVAGGLTGVAEWQRRATVEAQRATASGAFLAGASARTVTEPEQALRFGVAAVSTDDRTAAHDALVQSVLASTYLGATGPGGNGGPLATDAAARIMASGGDAGAVRLWSLDGRSAPEPVGSAVGAITEVHTVALTGDGSTLAIAGGAGWVPTLEKWDVSDPSAPVRLGSVGAQLIGGTSDMAFLPDGRTLVASGQAPGEVVFWDFSGPSDPVSLGPPAALHQFGIMHLDVSPDGRLLATASLDGTARLWDISDPLEPRALAETTGGPQQPMFAARIDPSGTVLATAGFDRQIRLYDITDPTNPIPRGQPVSGFAQAVTDLSFRTVPGPPSGLRLAAAVADGSTSVIDVTDPAAAATVMTLGGHTSAVTRTLLGPEGRSLLTGSSDGQVIAWDLDRSELGTRETPISLPDQVVWTGFDGSGTRVLAVGTDGSVAVRPTDGSGPGDQVVLPSRIAPTAAAAVAGGDLVLVGGATGTAAAVSTSDGTVTELPSLHAGEVTAVAATGGRGLAVTAAADGSLQTWAIDDGVRRLGPLVDSGLSAVTDAAFAPGDRYLYLADRLDGLSVWEVADTGEIARTPTVHPGQTSAVAVAAGPHIMVTGSLDHVLTVWDVSDPVAPVALGLPLPGFGSAVRTVALAPDARTLVAGGDSGQIVLFDLGDPTRPVGLAQYKQRLGIPLSAAFAPRGPLYAIAGQDGTVTMVDRTRMDEVRADPVGRACERAAGGLDPAAWAALAPGLAFEQTCPAS